MAKINPKQAAVIIKSLEGGVVPSIGIEHLLVGRKREVEEVIGILDDVALGGSDIRFWVGDFGSGKSFMLATIEQLALAKDFVSSTIDLAPQRRFYATDKKALALYSELVGNIKTKTSRSGNVIEQIIDQWLMKIFAEVSADKLVEVSELIRGACENEVNKAILDTLASFSSVGLSYEFGQALSKYYQAFVRDDRMLKMKALRWLRGDITTKTEAKRELGINRIIDDDNYFDGLKTLAELFVALGYKGFVVNFDEAVNLYKIPQAVTRERNYERILNIYNECKSEKSKGLFVNFGATRPTVFDKTRGMSSYGALQGRIGSEQDCDLLLVNTKRTVLSLKALTDEEIYTLLENLVNIYNINYKQEIEVSEGQIVKYMEGQLNRPGAHEFLTPRAVIKDFLEILDLKRQNEDITIEKILDDKYKNILEPVSRDPLDMDDDILMI
ncbi:ATP-binding protein [uncultured Anaerococcus sp.]|uniref:ATP-binding protein n=1 Tax=uncultured Anaerococcus sp. TaxID=293428 RepID=UPI0026398FE5|nr:ATP-binding protein [uncultured Anaerococcus sp.]